MLNLNKLSVGFTSLVLLGIGCLGASEAKATLLWKYTDDSPNDAVDGSTVGGGATPGYEMYGMAYGYDRKLDRFYVAVNSNLPLAGSDTDASGGNIVYGDLFLNFTGKQFHEINSTNNDKLFALRFASNDGNATSNGLYEKVTAKSVTSINSGFGSLEDYKSTVVNAGKTPSLGGIDSLGTTSGTWDYFDNNSTASTPILNVIDTGTKVGGDGFQALTDSALTSLGLDLNGFGAYGTQTYGFSFKASALGFAVGDERKFVAHLFAECGNDGMGFNGDLGQVVAPGVEVPEPSILAGLITLGLILKGCKGRKRA
jgi:hypothetical protein